MTNSIVKKYSKICQQVPSMSVLARYSGIGFDYQLIGFEESEPLKCSKSEMRRFDKQFARELTSASELAAKL